VVEMDQLLADDVVWHEIGRAEPRRGKAELRAAMGKRDWEITATVHDILANDDHGIILVDATATRGGRTFKYRTAEICHFRDGRISERWAFSDDTAAIVEFFA
jgi:ketosteroid isomerase-like protein